MIFRSSWPSSAPDFLVLALRVNKSTVGKNVGIDDDRFPAECTG
jgi:hypothetical protein